ncbi:putative RDD family membrane protein YckC [Gillisia mitskevichiae]|uniref:Putative RDD family membrane protein YckC n=1 Tax=Gillisia mitskevichiae TaxID=270921 RepID=A0A495NZE7_9FLAO|nr:cytochrome c oxidase assembly factor Coa1 family protein [Gillisia mitskevichiae]RKS42522.1 putative RDD family membrane protein YckC [Gillisia mitskevichiae]
MQLNLASRKRRLVALIIDYYVITFLLVSIIFLLLGPNFIEREDDFPFLLAIISIPLGLILYFGKDSVNGISFGKWIMGIVVRKESSSVESPSLINLFVRNITLLIWPLEFIVIVFNKNKQRHGDKIAKTIVYKNPNKTKKIPRILSVIGLGIIFFAFILSFVASSLKTSNAYKLAITEIENNKEINQQVGEIIDYGWMPTGNVNITNGEGIATYDINVIGDKEEMNVQVELIKPKDGKWKITSFNY